MGSISDFNRHAAQGKQAAEKYCKDWAKEIEEKGKALSEQLKLNRIDAKTYNWQRVTLNNEIKDLNSCVAKVNKLG